MVRVIALALRCFLLLAPTSFALAAADPTPSPVPSATASSAPAPAPTSVIDFVKARIDTMLRTGHADPSDFRLGFLAQIPAAKIDQTLAQITTRLGAHKSVEFTPQKLVAHFEKGTENILVHFDADYKIDMLLISPGVATLEDALKALQPPRGAVAYLITENPNRSRLDPHSNSRC